MKMNKKERLFSPQKLTILSVLVSLYVVAGFFSFGSGILWFNPIMLVVVLIGSVGGLTGTVLALIVADFLQELLTGGYYPAFAISAVLLGILVHCFFYQRELQLRRLKDWGTVLFAMLSVNLLWGILLNSYWLSLMYGMSYFSVVLSRLPLLLTAVIQSVLIMLILPRFRKIGQIRRLSGWVEK